MVKRSGNKRGRSGLKQVFLAGCCVTMAGIGPAWSASVSAPGTLSDVLRPPVVPVQDNTQEQPVADAPPADTSEEPVSANDLKAAINAIKERLARQQEGRATTGTSELAAELKNARQTIADLTESLSRLRGERDSILAEMKSLTDELGKRDDRIAGLQGDLAAASTDAKNRISGIEGELATTRAERDSLRGEAAESGRRLENALSEIAELTETVQQARADRDSVEQSLKEARDLATSELTTRDTALADAQSRLADLEAQLSARLGEQDQLNTQLANVRTSLAEQTTAAELKTEEANGLAAQLAERNAQLEERSQQLEQAESRSAELLAQSQQIEREAEGRLRERTQTLTANLEKANERVETLETEIQGLREVATASVAEVETLGQQVLELLEENEVIVSALTEVRASKALLDEELQAARNDVSVYSSDAALLREELARQQNGTVSGELAASGEDGTVARSLAQRSASLPATATKPSMPFAALTSSTSPGMKSGDHPCIMWGLKSGWLPLTEPSPLRACAIPLANIGELSGSQTMIRVCGLFSLSTRETPFRVPPVPKPVTQKSSRTSAKSSRISTAVVLAWVSALAGFSNCRDCHQPCVLASSSAFATIPVPFCAAGVRTTLAPRKRISLRRSTLKFSAIVTTSG